jgi:hypothetical protein
MALGEDKLFLDSLLGFSDLGKLAGCNYDAVLVDNTDGASYHVLHLMDYCLENAV